MSGKGGAQPPTHLRGVADTVKPIDIVRAWLEAMNAHDLPGMSALYAEDVVGDEVPDPPARDRRGLEESYRELFHGYPDCVAELLNIFSEGDQVLAEVCWVGTNTGEFRGKPPTNKPADLRIAYIFEVEEGRIKRITEYYDGASV
ncbi:hypothetical protein AC482_07460 [miscellaneous Crenarchaeota group-15 archaeon DG-45]|uniref:SnoaL-like domain-containing protein n=1 Tax=miscellaneous Crenarchaeota group-15 archaeon DG-45 TaxID=1685127 RepID=A0A0M0BKW3_9ARCH|nr:MAG: hypothetical protein AC482_07460 [miscellaneous Crenarchaeota group-15 archaeon DG-45]